MRSQVVEERAPNRFARVEDVMSRQELETASRSFHAAAGLDAHTIDNRPFSYGHRDGAVLYRPAIFARLTLRARRNYHLA